MFGRVGSAATDADGHAMAAMNKSANDARINDSEQVARKAI
jgi:hypothetical protein